MPLLALAMTLAVQAIAGAPPALAACANPVACENQLPGDPPSDWQVANGGDPTIQGFATSMSVNAGQTINFKINTPSTAYHVDILRLGYYGGDGARKVAAGIVPSAHLPQSQPACLTDSSTGLIDCGNWTVSASWTVPSNAVSGVYIAHLVRDDPQNPGGDSQIPFVVRNDASHSQILLTTSDATWEAYNNYGGNSLYTCTVACPPGNPGGYKAAYAVSYNRPFDGAIATDGGASYLYYAEYQLISYLEKNGYDISYTSDVDVDQSGSLLLNHKVFIASGHDEYWSKQQRANVTAARDAGVNLAFFSGNEIFWKTRWANSQDGSNTPYRTLISYKETHFDAPTDPKDPPTWTGTWEDPRFSPPADGGLPPNQLTGQQFVVNSGTADITVPSQYSKLRIWRNTAIANLTSGQSVTLGAGTGTLGYEWDAVPDNGFRPPGEFNLSSTTVSNVQAFTDYGTVVANGATETHHLSLYRAPSGALVFGAGTVQWAWGLDNTNAWQNGNTDPSGNPPDPNMEQATVNLFADMGAQPTTLQSGLVAASQSTDTTPPTSTISSPSVGANLADGSPTTISGSATDSGGGVVTGVEVSTDGGNTWHPATITTPDATTVSWSYTWDPHGYPSATIESRAVDDSGNLETPSSGRSVNITCPCSLWGSGVLPGTADSADTQSVNLGVKFTSAIAGQITGIRFYKATANAGTHLGSLWSATGTLLAQATFTNETASGWQTVTFPTPVNVSANTTYVASYLAPRGHYSVDDGYFYPAPSPPPLGGGSYNSPPLHAIPNATSANGVFAYNTTSTFPSLTYAASNYWVSPVLTPLLAPGQVTNVAATAGYNSASLTWSAPSGGGAPSTYTVTPYIGSAAQTPTTVTGSPPATGVTITGLQQGVPYTFTVQASNATGSGPVSAPSNSVTPTGPSAPPPPTGVTTSAASAQAQVSWTPPSTNNGSAITGYTITPYIGSSAQTPTQVNSGSATSAIVTGLANGTAYTFAVQATNALGTGPASSPSNAITPEDTVFDFGTPATTDSGDTSPVNLGVKFTADSSGQILGIRFYKAATNTGSHVGSLWSSGGSLLAQGTFTNETGSGWQTLMFSSPVSITAGTTYVASYLAPNGHYSATSGGLNSAVNNPPLHAVANGTSANGVYAYAGSTTFPANSYNATNYWVDVLFQPTAPGQVTGVSATPGYNSATVSWSAPSGSVSSYVVTPYIGSTPQTPTTITGSPPATTTTINNLTAGTTYTFTVQAYNGGVPGPVSAPSTPVTPTGPTVPAAPSGVVANPASGQALVSWTTPNPNGSPITGYTVTPYIGATAQTPVQVSGGAATSAPVTGLTNGTAYTFKVTATNGNGTGPASSASSAVTPENTIFDFGTPSTIDSGDTTPVNLGVKFTADTSGQVTGIRFYKAAANTGSHVGSLWTASGSLLAQATFTNESASGWQTVNFSSPVSVTAGTTYVASYFAPKGHYSATSAGLNSAVNNPPLHAVANSVSANGVYAYSGASTFPANSYNATNYWVDVLFQGTAPGQVTNVTATAGLQSATVSWSAPASGGATKYIVTPYIGSIAQTPTTITGSPPATTATINNLTAGTAYTFTVQAASAAGTGPASAPSGSVTPTGPTVPAAPSGVTASPATGQALVSWTAPSSNGSPITGYTVTPYLGSTAQTPTQVNNGSATSSVVTGLSNGTAYTFKVTATNGNGTGPASGASSSVTPENAIFDFGTPSTIDSGDTTAVEMGVKFKADADGSITGIRFYKAAANTGTHIGSLWTASGTLLASATFTNETGSGWQTVNFSSPVAITAGTTYVAGYFAPNGHYSATPAGLSSSVDNPPLHAIANSTSANGVYAYNGSSTFPSNSYNAANYWVDVLYAPAPPPGQPSNVSATAQSGGASVSWSAPSSGGAPSSYIVTPYIGSTAQTQTTVAAPATNATVSGLTSGTSYTFTVTAANTAGSGPPSAPSNAVTPTSSAPSAPQNVAASPATSQAQVTWSAPASNGGSPITGYTITPYIGSTAQTPVQVNNGSATSGTVTGLTNGTSYTFTVTATNGAGTGPASSAASAVTPQDTIFDFGTPSTIDSGDPTAVELGVKFKADADGSITGIRFYKAGANIGTHLGSLWTTGGTLLASATFANETASGWQTVSFSSPVLITAGATYVAGYFAPNGHYSVTPAALNSTVDNPPLHTIANGTSANGVYAYNGSSTFPTSTSNAANYWVDVLYATVPAPGQATNVAAMAQTGGASVSWSAPSTGGPATGYTITPYIGSAAQTTTTVSGAPAPTNATITGLTAGTSYTFTVTASNSAGSGSASAASNSVTPTGSAPSVPQNVSASPATSQALLTWSAPASNGGSPITGYTITPYIGSTAQTPVQVSSGSATSATITGLTNGTGYTFTVTASNSGGPGPASSASSVVTPENTIFDFGAPSTVDSGDTSPIEVGVKFTADVNGHIAGIRFYKAGTNTGTHTGNLWSSTGTLLASATFTNEAASGWQTVLFSSPVAITTGTTYVASYFAPNGHYSATPAGLSTSVDNPPLHAIANSISANGIYTYGASSVFPTSSFNAANYWVDVLFATP